MVASVTVRTSDPASLCDAPGSRRARVLIAEDHPVMRDGIVGLLLQEPAAELVGCAETAAQVEDLVQAERPDVLVLDLTLGTDDGVDLARRLRQRQPSLKILVLSMHDELMLIDRLLSIGVQAYVTKDRTSEEFLLALRSVLRGGTYVTEEQRERLALYDAKSKPLTPEAVLSERELEVLRLLAMGLDSVGIARKLSMAVKTVYSHRRHISSKLGIPSGREIVRYAVHWARGHG